MPHKKKRFSVPIEIQEDDYFPDPLLDHVVIAAKEGRLYKVIFDNVLEDVVDSLIVTNPMTDEGDLIIANDIGEPSKLAVVETAGRYYLSQNLPEVQPAPAETSWRTLANLQSDLGLSAYVPYENATGDVDLNDNALVNVKELGIGTDEPEELIHALQPDTSLAANILLASDRTGAGGKAGFMLKSNETGNHARFIFRRHSVSSVLSDEVLLTFRDEVNETWLQLLHYRLDDKNFLLGQGADTTHLFGSVAIALPLGDTPTRTLDINGDLRIRTISSVTEIGNILATDGIGDVKSIAKTTHGVNRAYLSQVYDSEIYTTSWNRIQGSEIQNDLWVLRAGDTMTGHLYLPDTIATTGDVDNSAVPKWYVDQKDLGGLKIIKSVKVVATSNVDISPSATQLTIDGVDIEVGDEFLLTNQSTETENGIYVTSQPTAQYNYTRRNDADEDDELVRTLIPVTEGDTLEGSVWACINDEYIVNTDIIRFTIFVVPSAITAGDGLIRAGVHIHMGTPSSVTVTSTNSTTTNSHTHQLVLPIETRGDMIVGGTGGSYSKLEAIPATPGSFKFLKQYVYEEPIEGDPQYTVKTEWEDIMSTHTKFAASSRILGRVTSGDGYAEELTGAQVITLLGIATGADNYGYWTISDGSNTFNVTSELSVEFSGDDIITVLNTSGLIDISHKSTNGYKHIPADGAVGQLLQNSAAGTAVWWTPDYLTSFTETDPTVPAHVKAITSGQITNWDTAYGWGNHAEAGYLTSIPLATSSIRGGIQIGYDASSNLNRRPLELEGEKAYVRLTNIAIQNGYGSVSPNTVWAGPISGPDSGIPGFRALVAADIPDLSGTYLTELPDHELNDHTNVGINPFSLADNHILYYDDDASEWLNKELNLSALVDVNFPGSLANWQILRYNSTTSKWENDSFPTTTVQSDDITLEGNGTSGDKLRIKDLNDSVLYGIRNGAFEEITNVSGSSNWNYVSGSALLRPNGQGSPSVNPSLLVGSAAAGTVGPNLASQIQILASRDHTGFPKAPALFSTKKNIDAGSWDKPRSGTELFNLVSYGCTNLGAQNFGAYYAGRLAFIASADWGNGDQEESLKPTKLVVQLCKNESFSYTAIEMLSLDNHILSINHSIEVKDTGAYYLGDKDTDSSWRFIRSGDNLLVQRRESGLWVTKDTITA
jgi:hypothetical protein